MFRPFRDLSDAVVNLTAHVQEVRNALSALVTAQQALAPAKERLDNLELSRHQFEAKCEGMLLRAEGKLKAAANAEQRERQLKKSYEHLLDPIDEIGVEPETAGRDRDSNNDAAPSEEERVSALRLDVAPTDKTLAQRAKFGVR